MGELVFSQYVGVIMQLDKARYEEIQKDPSLQTLSPEDKLKAFSSEFQSQVKSLWNAFEAHQNATQTLAKNVYGIITLTGSTLDEASKLIETAFNRGISRSYMSKLYSIGKLLTSKPELSAVKDVEKIYEVSRIPESRLDAALASVNVASATRDQVRDLVKQETGKTETPSETKAPSMPTKAKYVAMISKIEAMAHDIGDDAELSALFSRVVSTLNSRVSAIESAKQRTA